MCALRLGLLAALALSLATGCSHKSLANVSGKVKYKGEALPAGNITFHSPDQGLYTAVLHEDGSYELSDLPAGTPLEVTVETETYNPHKSAPAYGGGKGAAIDAQRLEAEKRMGRPINEGGARKYVKIPPRYAKPESSHVTVTLQPGPQTKDIELTD